MGQPLESALCSCVVAMRLGEALNLDGDTLRDVYYQALLRYIGCNADTHALAAIFGDELALRHDFAAVDPGQPPEVLGLATRFLQQANAGESPDRIAALVARALLTLPQLMHESFAGHCEVAQQLATRLGFAESLIVSLGQLYERWNGKGQPHGLKGDEVAVPVLLVTLAQDAVVWARIGGVDAAVATVRQRSGGAEAPGLWPVQPRHGRPTLPLARYRQAPHPAYLRQYWPLYSCWRDPLCHGERSPLKWPERAMFALPDRRDCAHARRPRP
jgi:hypothetical protein